MPDAFGSVLPEGVWPSILLEVERKLVNDFSTSRTRARVFDGLQIYLRDLQNLGLSGLIWIGGSFVTSKDNPADVDVLSLVPSALVNRLAPHDQQFALSLLEGSEATKARYDVHSFNVLSVPETNVAHPIRAELIRGWIDFLGHTKRFVGENGQLTKRPKGLVALDFGDTSAIEGEKQWLTPILTRSE